MLWIIGRCQISGKFKFTNNEVPVMRGKLPSHDQETYGGGGKDGGWGGGGEGPGFIQGWCHWLAQRSSNIVYHFSNRVRLLSFQCGRTNKYMEREVKKDFQG